MMVDIHVGSALLHSQIWTQTLGQVYEQNKDSAVFHSQFYHSC